MSSPRSCSPSSSNLNNEASILVRDARPADHLSTKPRYYFEPEDSHVLPPGNLLHFWVFHVVHIATPDDSAVFIEEVLTGVLVEGLNLVRSSVEETRFLAQIVLGSLDKRTAPLPKEKEQDNSGWRNLYCS